ncbi:acyl-ACP--UDP-N-acetylglucosamine O-acyltransferase [Kamptonema cortianum]|nr:acyl-ACP--UDP-N-acetylglucosamine O-acyltransferase [Oscillatoria laete-virens]MDK3159917.1 acyl-ACP--UDP-N-acetylglucosamine O-acyltransferase [Kamptonema cortianum]MDL5050514.1 acyl-ACP--UDP-N-acetylglucosamine O-acyltransferase [Oscillatoria amoena NRMC-F 0135]MDL5055526.1 acyl-ACP--UDP-N-acetylglucosamine O-acyltransferase [Oscillatoria laete-virens NRMC-F 0139]
MSSSIHPTAIIDPSAHIAEGVEIGPYCVIRGPVTIGAGTRLLSHVLIEGPTTIGKGNLFHDFAAIGSRTQDLKYTGEPTYCEIGDDNTFREFVTMHRGTSPGEKTIVGSRNLFLANVHIAHNCELGNEIIISNLGSMAGHVTVEDRCVIGGMAAIHQFCRIGTMSMIGGCSKVVQDVPPYMLVDGSPAEVRTPNKIGLERRGISAESQNALKTAYKILFRQKDKTLSESITQAEKDCPKTPEIIHLLSFIRDSKRGICH